MADELDQEEGNAAAEAFEGLRGEVTLLRRAVERLAAERAEVPAPKDYDETLGRIAQAINKLAERMDALADRPGVKITPEGIARQIATAGGTTRAEDQRTIAEARGALERATAQLAGVVAAARRSNEQNRGLAWAAIGGMVAGAVFYAALAGPIARAMPDSWLWPERMATRTLDMPMWQAGGQLLATADPAAYRTLTTDEEIARANRDTIEGCRKAAARTRDAVRCTITIKPAERRP